MLDILCLDSLGLMLCSNRAKSKLQFLRLLHCSTVSVSLLHDYLLRTLTNFTEIVEPLSRRYQTLGDNSRVRFIRLQIC
jgi:hypothetical protein